MKLNCYNVVCQNTKNDEIINVGVMCADPEIAKKLAVDGLKDGRNIDAKAIKVEETKGI